MYRPWYARMRPGLWLAAGHGHLGLTDSANTGARIADAMLGAAPYGGNTKPDESERDVAL
jgi:D-amino-acid dehydrogenase